MSPMNSGTASCRRLSALLVHRLALAVAVALSFFTAALEAQEELRVKHILAESEEAARSIRQEIIDQGGDRKAFSQAARDKSKDATTRILGGDLGWISTRSGFDAVFTKAAFDLPVGTISEPIKTEFGWHLILVTEQREKPPAGVPEPPPTDPTRTAPPAGTGDLVPPQQPDPAGRTGAAGATPPAGAGEAGTPPAGAGEAATTPEPAVEVKRRTLPASKAFRITLETVKSSNLNVIRPQTFAPEEAVEVNVTIKNESSADQEIFSPVLLPLGLTVREAGGVRTLPGDFSSLAEPDSFLRTLKKYELAGYEFSLNEYFTEIGKGRYTFSWSVSQLFNQLELRFPAVKELPDYESLKSGLQGTGARFSVDVVARDLTPHARSRRRQGLDFAVYDPLDRNETYYARIRVTGETQPVVIRLETQKQFNAANHFASLVLAGFYDGLDFFDVQPGDYLLGGDPELPRNGTGGPTGLMTAAQNLGQLPHKRGTVSFVTRGLVRAPAAGAQIGSIFFVCLKDRPEWDDEHVPFGEVVAGLELLEKQAAGSTVRFDTVTLLSSEEYEGTAPADSAAAAQVAANPQAVIKTAKGEITVELFEDTSANTVANFVTLAEDEYFDRQKIHQLIKNDEGKPVAILTGSPDGSLAGGPGYTIADEISDARKCVRGALVMVKRWDPESNNYEPNSAGSQYFICLDAIPYFDSLKQFTVFGQVRSGLDVLDQLAEGDEVTSVEITQKKETPYTVRKNS